MIKQLNVKMPAELLEALKELAAHNDRSVAGELRAMIKEKLRSSRAKANREGSRSASLQDQRRAA